MQLSHHLLIGHNVRRHVLVYKSESHWSTTNHSPKDDYAMLMRVVSKLSPNVRVSSKICQMGWLCLAQKYAKWDKWTDWSECSEPCGHGGRRARHRTCTANCDTDWEYVHSSRRQWNYDMNCFEPPNCGKWISTNEMDHEVAHFSWRKVRLGHFGVSITLSYNVTITNPEMSQFKEKN